MSEIKFLTADKEEAQREVVGEPTLISIEFNPPLLLGDTYQDGTIMTIKGYFDDICLAYSGGTGIEPSCYQRFQGPLDNLIEIGFPGTKRIEQGLNVADFELGFGAPLCHRQSAFHEIHFLDNKGNVIKKVLCEDLRK